MFNITPMRYSLSIRTKTSQDLSKHLIMVKGAFAGPLLMVKGAFAGPLPDRMFLLEYPINI